MAKKEKEVNPLWGGRFTKGTGQNGISRGNSKLSRTGIKNDKQ